MATIYEPRGAAREYSPLALNYFTGCDHGCKYCYVPKIMGRFRAGYNHSAVSAKDRVKLLKEIETAARKHQHSEKQVFLSFLTDPYSKFNDETKLTRAVLEILLAHEIPVSILTKGGSRMLADLDIFAKFGKNIKIGATLTLQDKFHSEKWEPGASSPMDRINSLREVHSSGVTTWASMEPVIYPADSLGLMEKTHPFVDGFKIGKLNHHTTEEAKTDWGAFLLAAVKIMRDHGKTFYIKKDLLSHRPEGLHLEPHETDMDFMALRNQFT